MMHPIIGGAAARPFVTHHNALDMKLYMRIAPELYLKRLVVGGFERVYEINRNFRNEGLSRQHNPEFTMLEFYQAYATYTDLMDLTEAAGRRARARGQRRHEGHLGRRRDRARGAVAPAVDPRRGPRARRIAEADRVFEDPVFAAEVARRARRARRRRRARAARGRAARRRSSTPSDVARLQGTSPRLARSIVERYPDDGTPRRAPATSATCCSRRPPRPSSSSRRSSPSSRSRCRRSRARTTAIRRSAIASSCSSTASEIANGFSELNDPDDQRARFQAQVARQGAGAAETMDYDEDYCRALEVGMPPTAGEGIGIDRLAMLLTGQASIRDVILFPLMRPE